MNTLSTTVVLGLAASISVSIAAAPARAESVDEVSMALAGYIQSDARFADDTSDFEENNSFVLRRARLNLEGNFAESLAFRVGAEFGDGGDGELYDAYLDWQALPFGGLRIGKFKPPLGLERLQSSSRLWLPERSLVDNLIPNRDVGIAWQTSGRLEAAIGVFNQATDRRREDDDVDDGKVLVARIFGRPFDGGPFGGLGVGIGGSYGEAEDAPAQSTSQTTGRNTVFSYRESTRRDGTESRISPQLYWFVGPFGLLGEYVVSRLELTDGAATEKVSNEAWQLATSWIVTGEANGWRGITPASPFRSGGWGALELVARVSTLEHDDDLFPVFADPADSVRKARAYEVGVNWYPTAELKFSVNLSHTEFDGGAAEGADRDDEKLVLARAQVAF